MVTVEKLDEAIKDAERFIEKAMECRKKLKNDSMAEFCGCKETGTVKRASMDLTNSLIELRK